MRVEPAIAEAIAPAATERRGRRLLSFGLRMALGVGLLVFLLTRIDRASLARILVRDHPSYFAAAVALYIAGQLLCAWRWTLLARMIGLGGSIAEFIGYYLVGVF